MTLLQRLLALFAPALVAHPAQAISEDDLLPVEQAFVLSASGNWETHDAATLMNRLHAELEETLARPLPPPHWHQLIRERRATFACHPKLPRPAPKTPQRGLWLAGDYVCADYPATLEGAIRSGIQAARGVLMATKDD